jgi:hypothetical protein
MSIRPLKYMLLGLVLALLFLGYAFGEKWEDPPAGQPAQMRSKVDYDPRLNDPFFQSNEFVKHPNALFEESIKGSRKAPRRVQRTAKCFSTSFNSKHEVHFCEVRSLDGDRIVLYIHSGDWDVSHSDNLVIRIKDGMLTSQFWTCYFGGPTENLTWTTIRQKLTLDKSEYKKGDLIKGRIDFECAEGSTNPKEMEAYRRDPTTIKLWGVFKTVVK